MSLPKLVKAGDLGKNSTSKREMREMSIMILDEIKIEIENAVDNKETSIDYQLQSVFEIANSTSITDDQLYIWGPVIRHLKYNDYYVKLLYKPERSICILRIKWGSTADRLEKEHLKRILEESKK